MSFYMHVKFMKFVMHTHHAIPGLLTKWHIQILLGLHVVSFLRSAMNFNQLLLHVLGLIFGYNSLHDIPNVHKNLNKIWTPRIMSNNFQSFLNKLHL
jgi:hypothetical protein